MAIYLISHFKEINDLYIIERVLAACYGAVLQGLTIEKLPELASEVFTSFFANGSPPPHILLRDYGRGILEYAHWRSALPRNIDLKLAQPPYKSEWPISYVSKEDISKFTEEYNSGQKFSSRIVHSCVENGDFARYVIDNTVDDWILAPINTKHLPSNLDLFTSWFRAFQQKTTKERVKVFINTLKNALNKPNDEAEDYSSEHEHRKKAEETLQGILSKEEWDSFQIFGLPCFNDSAIEKSLTDSLVLEVEEISLLEDTGNLPVRLEGDLIENTFKLIEQSENNHADNQQRHWSVRFNQLWARRWVAKRAHDLGWESDLFSRFDADNRTHDRREHQVERIGKKYQWLALYEILARIADNLAMDPGYDGEMKAYRGPWQIYKRNLDPSLLVRKTYSDGWRQWPSTWWAPYSPKLTHVPPKERKSWVFGVDDIVQARDSIEIQDRNGENWLALGIFSSTRQYNVSEGHRHFERNCSLQVHCFVTRKADSKKLIREIKRSIWKQIDDFPQQEMSDKQFIGEYPWHPSIEFKDWTPFNQKAEKSVLVRPTVARLTWETGGYDFSMESSGEIYLPAPWLIHKLGLRLANGQRLNYVNRTNKIIFFDPSVAEKGPNAALIRRDSFVQLLEDEELQPFWAIVGQKQAFPSSIRMDGFLGELLYVKLLTFEGNEVVTILEDTKENHP